MIVDRLEHLNRYALVHPSMPKIIELLRTLDLASLPAGKTVVDSQTYILRDSYPTKPLSECYFEGHRLYADLQMVLSGTEYFGYATRESNGVTVTTPYNPEKDVEKFEIPVFSRIRLDAGMFAIAFPEDLHLVKLMTETAGPVEKAVLKFLL